MPDARVGDRFGAFELVRRIGGGGNADVFEATDGQRTVAVKILRNRRVDSEPYARFRREIKVLRTLGEWPGVLPLIDADLPDSLARGQRAWLAMPIARRIDEALRDAELSVIVAAIGSIADALAALQKTSGLVHRDLKPENLYEYEGRFVVGDFGLVSLPDTERLTAPGKVVGPANFVAYELMEDPLGSGRCLLPGEVIVGVGDRISVAATWPSAFRRIAKHRCLPSSRACGRA
jgi:serine/threonine protein kinase